MAAVVGQPAPDFTLKSHDAEDVSKSDLSGSPSLIVFIPLPFSAVCEGELCTIRDNLGSLSGLDAKVVVITCDTRFANKKWHDDNGFGFPVLSDFWPHGATAQAFGCFNERLGVADRATYVLDADGVVRDVITSDHMGTAREFDSYAAALAAI